MSQRKLLLADDSITIQKVVNLTFADEGIEVVTVGDGDAAMEKISEFKPDLIMADVNMPGLNGYQICEKIKQSDEFGEIPVILLVGSFEPFDEAEAQRVGADEFLTKPFQSIRQLVSKVTELLDSSGKSADAAEGENTERFADGSQNSYHSDVHEAKFSDAGMDDEMIQTNQPSGFSLDEAGKFETRDTADFSEDSAKTQPLSFETVQQFSSSIDDRTAGNIESGSGNVVNEENSAGAGSQDELQETEASAFSSNSPTDLDFNDDFLELPPEEDEEETEDEQKALPPDAIAETENRVDANEIEAQANETETLPEQTEAFSVSEVSAAPGHAEKTPEENAAGNLAAAASPELSPATIDLIVQKVVEKLSDKVVREIAWEVVPQMTDLIVKKMAEEKMKES